MVSRKGESNLKLLLTKPILLFSKCFFAFPYHQDLTRTTLGICCSLLAIALCLMHLYFLPSILIGIERTRFQMQGKPYTRISYNYVVKMLFPCTVFITSAITRINSLFFLQSNLRRLQENICRLDSHPRINQHIRRYWWFSIAVVSIIVVLTLPINIIRICLFYNFMSSNIDAVLLFVNMYFQNISTCANEMQFITIVYRLVLRARSINQSLEKLLHQQDFLMKIKYYELIKEGRGVSTLPNVLYPLKATVEELDSLGQLRKMYKYLYEACRSLQKAYQLSLLFSLCCLCLMLLFDIYFEFYGFIGGNAAKPSFATYLWCLQYVIRFVFIVEISQKMYDEGVKTRQLVSNLKHKYLNAESREELSLFMNYLANTRIEFTACDFFILNTRLITSAIAAGTTYLVILIQFHADKYS